MRRVNTIMIAAAAFTAASATAARAQQAEVVGHSVDMSSRQARLGLELAGGGEVNITLNRGVLRINGREAGRYEMGGPLERSWRELLENAASLPTGELKTRLAGWRVAQLGSSEAALKQRMDQALRDLPEAGETAMAEWDDPAAAAAIEAETRAELAAERISEQVSERLSRAMERAQGRDLPVLLPPAPRGAGDIGTNVAGLIGVFVALACIGFGLVSFAPRQLDAVSEALDRSFLRSFLAGLFAQPLLLPVFGMLVVGLILTVVGIIVLPLAAIGFVLAVAVGLVGGYLAVARSFGQTILRRRATSRGWEMGVGPYRSLLVGLAGLLAVWAPFALLSWVPGAGWLLLALALIFTWIMATAGFGAAILSRAGFRSTFGRPHTDSLWGEDPWTTGELAASRAAMKELE